MAKWSLKRIMVISTIFATFGFLTIWILTQRVDENAVDKYGCFWKTLYEIEDEGQWSSTLEFQQAENNE